VPFVSLPPRLHDQIRPENHQTTSLSLPIQSYDLGSSGPLHATSTTFHAGRECGADYALSEQSDSITSVVENLTLGLEKTNLRKRVHEKRDEEGNIVHQTAFFKLLLEHY
jgi:hypothetical protein